jgi:hypothetical protein
MAKVGAIGGCRAKVLLVGEQGELALDGSERDDGTWRPRPIEPAQSVMDALHLELSKLAPVPSALQMLLNEKLGGHD